MMSLKEQKVRATELTPILLTNRYMLPAWQQLAPEVDFFARGWESCRVGGAIHARRGQFTCRAAVWGQQ